MDVTCYLAVGEPYGGAPGADVVVDAAVYCDDYFGAATAVVARYDLYPPVISATKRSFDVQISCGGPDVGIPTPPNCQVNPQLCARMTD